MSEQLLREELEKANAEIERLRERNTRQRSIIESCDDCCFHILFDADDQWPLAKLRHQVAVLTLRLKRRSRKLQLARSALERSHACATFDNGYCVGCFVSEALEATKPEAV